MVKTKIYIEGGGDSKELKTRCREGFRKLFDKCGFTGRMPQLIACGSRNDTFSDFSKAHELKKFAEFVAMLVDSEDPVGDIERTWSHLHARDNWVKPDDAVDEQVLLMTTCMETWISADRDTLRSHYPGCLRENDLPHLTNMEERTRQSVQDSLVRATRDCKNRYEKGKRSFEILAKLNPEELKSRLASFARLVRILNERL